MLNKREKEGNIPNLRKAIYENPEPTSYLIVKDNTFLKIRNKTRMSALTTSFQPCSRGFSQRIRQEKQKPSRLERKK